MSYNVVGHLGSHLSYATIAVQLCRALHQRGLLGSVTNLDDRCLEEHGDILSWGDGKPTHAILLADPMPWLLQTLDDQYGAKRTALYLSPNTNRIDRDRARACESAGLVLAPSWWCAEAVHSSVFQFDLERPERVGVVPLGVADEYHNMEPKNPEDTVRLLHLSTDFAWPGRKGTEELLQAWDMVQHLLPENVELLLHVPFPMYEPVHFAVADMELSRVRVVMSPSRGSTDEDLASLVQTADVLVLPARAEGFGMMILAACVARKPLLTTFVTGHAEFLSELDGWLGVAIPAAMGPMAFEEEGEAPVVNPSQLAKGLLAITSEPMLSYLRERAATNAAKTAKWTWAAVMDEWIQTLEEWRMAR